jgi:hypothetical protein
VVMVVMVTPVMVEPITGPYREPYEPSSIVPSSWDSRLCWCKSPVERAHTYHTREGANKSAHVEINWQGIECLLLARHRGPEQDHNKR